MDDPNDTTPPHSGIGDSTPKKNVRGITRMQELVVSRLANEQVPIQFDMVSGKAIGPNKAKFNSYVGVLARTKTSITYPHWLDVPENIKNNIWEDITLTWTVENNRFLRTKIISYAGERWRSFKTGLYAKYITGEKCGKNPCETYPFIEKKAWDRFIEMRADPGFLEQSRKAQEIQANNKCPHTLSRGGYDLLREKMTKERKRSHDKEISSNPSGIINPPPPRHELWKRARLKKTGKFSTPEAAQVAEKIDLLEKEASQGRFVPLGRDDILTTALGNPEHPGQVRTAGRGVGWRSYWKSTESKKYTQSDMNRKVKELEERVDMKIKTALAVLEEKLTKRNTHCETLVDTSTHSHVRVSMKGSNVPLSGDDGGDDDVDEDANDDMCKLYVDPLHLVAMGKVHNLGLTIHHHNIDKNNARVEVVQIIDAGAPIPIPSDEVQTVGQTPKQFILWPRRLINTCAPQKQEDPLKRLHRAAINIENQSMQLVLTEEVIGRTPITLYLGQNEIVEICYGRVMLSAVILQLWLLYLHQFCTTKGNLTLYGFIDPHTCQDVGNNETEIQTYIQRRLNEGGKECYFLPYFYPNHWQLLVLCPRRNIVVFFCSVGNKPRTHIKSIIDMAMQAHQRTISSRKRKTKWIHVNSQMQQGGYECGYYVMRHMLTIVSASVTEGWEKVFNKTDSFSQDEIDDIRERWASFFLQVIQMYVTDQFYGRTYQRRSRRGADTSTKQSD